MKRFVLKPLELGLRSQKVRFLIAGSFNTGIDFVLFNILVLLIGLPTIGGNLIAVTSGIAISYLLNHFFVFRYTHPVSLSKFGQFFLVTGFSSLILQSIVIRLFEMLFDTSFGHSLLFIGTADEKHFFAINIAKAAAVFVGLVWNFCMYKYVVFRKNAAEAAVGTYPAAVVPETKVTVPPDER